MKKIDLAKHQPRYYQNSAVMQAINYALASELELLFGMVDEMLRELRIETSEKLLDLWERSVGLPENPALELSQRRSRVLARRRQLDAATPARIKAIAESYARGDVDFVEDARNSEVTIRFVNRVGKPDNMEGLIKQLRMIMPAQLVLNFSYPYRTWGDLMESGLTWGELLDSGVTWNDLMNKEDL